MKTPPRYWLLLRAVTSAYMAVTLMEFMGGFSNGKSLLAAIKDLEDKHTRIEEHQQANEAGPALQLWNWATGVQEGQENSVQMLSRNVQLVLHSLWGDEVDHLKASPERARPQVLNLLKKKRKQLFITIISIVVLAVSFIMSASKRTICMKLIFNIFASIWFLGSGFWFQRTYDHRLFWMCLVAMQSQMRAAKREDDNENYEQVVEHGRGAVTRLMIRGPLAATCLFWFVNTLPGVRLCCSGHEVGESSRFSQIRQG
eukprot:TRINITY_DN38528_c0_g1_i1.p1 TRINITY_DN38528_c0_g1~~TRINITY_DN38528_c0_g1_i1.p1  ORF type:complete len:257 (-),score=16.16 TRINITY_DN38528_c0_g1_i1:422-1192(-)